MSCWSVNVFIVSNDENAPKAKYYVHAYRDRSRDEWSGGSIMNFFYLSYIYI